MLLIFWPLMFSCWLDPFALPEARKPKADE